MSWGNEEIDQMHLDRRRIWVFRGAQPHHRGTRAKLPTMPITAMCHLLVNLVCEARSWTTISPPQTTMSLRNRCSSKGPFPPVYPVGHPLMRSTWPLLFLPIVFPILLLDTKWPLDQRRRDQPDTEGPQWRYCFLHWFYYLKNHFYYSK